MTISKLLIYYLIYDISIDIIGVTKSGNQERPVFYIYNPQTTKFEAQEIIGVHYEDAYIENLIANDFNGDDKFDLMITYSSEASNNTYSDSRHSDKFSNSRTDILLYNSATSSYEKVYQFTNITSGIFIADIGSTRNLDFIFYDEETKTRKLLHFDATQNAVVEDFSKYIAKDKIVCNRGAINVNYPISNPHSSAFIDIDGDCLNDMLIMSSVEKDNSTVIETTDYLEIWRGIIEDGEIKYCLTQSSIYELDQRLGLFSLADINNDALMDIIFPVLGSTPPQILIAFNKVKIGGKDCNELGVCKKVYTYTDDYCAFHNPFTQNSTSTAPLTIPLVFEEFRIEHSSNMQYLQSFTLTQLPHQTFLNTPSTPAYLRFADINIDSFPDFTVVLYDESDYTQNIYVFLNSALDENFPESNPREFSKNFYQIQSINNAIYSSFFDMNDDGKLDLIVVKQENNNIYNTAGFFNTHIYDAFYLKSVTLDQSNGMQAIDYGTTFRYVSTNIDGTNSLDLATQAPQVSTPLALHLPYGYMGIGRSNNYIENFHVILGNYVQPTDNYNIFTPLIPNSQIVVRHIADIFGPATGANNTSNTNLNPNSSQLNGYNENIVWKLDLNVKPTQGLPLLISIIVIILLCLVVAIAYLHFKEMKEDTRENEEGFAQWFG